MEQLMKVDSSLLSLEERSTLKNLRFNYNASSQVMGMFQNVSCQIGNDKEKKKQKGKNKKERKENKKWK